MAISMSTIPYFKWKERLKINHFIAQLFERRIYAYNFKNENVLSVGCSDGKWSNKDTKDANDKELNGQVKGEIVDTGKVGVFGNSVVEFAYAPGTAAYHENTDNERHEIEGDYGVFEYRRDERIDLCILFQSHFVKYNI